MSREAFLKQLRALRRLAMRPDGVVVPWRWYCGRGKGRRRTQESYERRVAKYRARLVGWGWRFFSCAALLEMAERSRQVEPDSRSAECLRSVVGVEVASLGVRVES